MSFKTYLSHTANIRIWLWRASLLATLPGLFTLPSTPNALANNSRCQDITITPASLEVFPLHHARIGDTEMGGHDPTIAIRAQAERRRQSILITGTVTMREGKSDWTTFQRDFVQETYVGELSDSRCEVLGMTPTSGSLMASTGGDNHRFMRYAGQAGRLVQSAFCRADTDGNDNGKLGCRNVQFSSITIRRRELPQPPREPRPRSCSILESILTGCR